LRNIVRLVVVEGYMDVVGLARHGIDFAVATLGTATTDDHLNRLFRLCDEVLFCFDGDRAGRSAAWRALEVVLPQIRDGRQIRFVFLPDGEDPDSFVRKSGVDAFEQALADGTALSDFLVQELSGPVDLQSVDGRARLAELARPLLHRVPHGVYRVLLMERLADAVGLSAGKLEGLLAGDAGTAAAGRAGAGKPSRRSPGRPSAARPSVVRRAITLVLHYPDAAGALDVEQLAGVSRPGIDLLRDLIETVQAEPHLSMAGLLERWRNHEEGRHLGRLAAVELPPAEEFDPAAELKECLQQLALAGSRDRVQILIEKQSLGCLTEAERSELRQLARGPSASG
jgi:DNA primase